MTGPTEAALLERLWSDEGCTWQVRHDSDSNTWVVVLNWSTDTPEIHQADFQILVWEFHDTTVEEALWQTIGWLQGLAAWRRCGVCDGSGSQSGESCEACQGTGLAVAQ